MKKFTLFSLIFVLILVLSGCGSTTMNHNPISNIKETVTKAQTVVKTVNVVNEQSLLIPEIMDEKDYSTLDEDQNSDIDFQNGTNISRYVAKLYTLSNTAQKSIKLNSNTEYLISCVNSKSNSLKNICDLFEKKDCNITKSNKSAITDLCNSLLLNINRLDNSKDDAKNDATEITVLKRNYTSNVEKLNGKYNKLINSIETRNSYLNNICYGMDNLYDILISICYPQVDTSKVVQNTWSNIDTYKNNNKRINNEQHNNNYQYYNNKYMQPNNRYGYGYGYGGTNPFYGYGMFGGMRGFGGYSSYPYSPYTNYNPYIPNIDTFGTYKNVDTYKSFNDEYDDQYNNDYENFYPIPFYPYGYNNGYEHIKIYNYQDEQTQENSKQEYITNVHVKKVDDKPKIEKLMNNEKKELA